MKSGVSIRNKVGMKVLYHPVPRGSNTFSKGHEGNSGNRLCFSKNKGNQTWRIYSERFSHEPEMLSSSVES